MSSITATPAPSFDAPRTSGRRILVAGAVVAGLVVAGAVAIPRITAQTSTTSYPAVTQHDAIEHQAADARAAAAASAQKAVPEGYTRAYVGGQLQLVPIAPPLVGQSVVNQQTGKLPTYPFSQSSAHTTWTDPWVPPYDNPEWVPYIKSHYFQPVTTATTPTHEFR